MDSKEELNEYNNVNAGSGYAKTPYCRVTTSSKIYFLVFMSLLFSVATVFAGVMEIMENKISFFDFIRIIIVILAAIVVAISAISDSSQVAVFKSFVIFMVFLSDFLVTGLDTIKFAIKTLERDFKDIAAYYDISESLVIVYAVILLVWFASMYLFMVLDIIRGVFKIKKLKILIILCGYIAFISICGQIMLKMIIEGRCQLVMELFPVNFIYITFILADLMVIGSKRKQLQLEKKSLS